MRGIKNKSTHPERSRRAKRIFQKMPEKFALRRAQCEFFKEF